ncbi:hypothetical protein B0I35DRAFT_5609 [Stachybotrys elegans]|uniref:Bul1 C-terminal domain-containing protein n=1 Tax=Stachybotrys elegans TaxID=80388 RepID=A0A8K0WXM0_9HYPO|nr:hypothetical protein B0I35DRAFT_5609 [Stachybotrys elegans]
MPNHTEAGGVHRNTAEIVIDGHYSSKVYTSGSSITGRAIIRPTHDVTFSNFEIIFTGSAGTRIDFVQQFPAHSIRNFMKLRMPIYDTDLPRPRIFREGHTYTIPFHFVVPHELTIGACCHSYDNPAVQAQHVQPPPTMGFWECDDQAPEMAKIEYAVKARAFDLVDGDLRKVLEGYHIVKVLPASPEQAPLDISWKDERYQLSKTKTIRKNLFSGKLGKLTSSATQPAAIMLPADAHGASSTSARINFEFHPTATDVTPPKISSVSGKIISTTYFSVNPVRDFPNLGSRSNHLNVPALTYSNTTSLFSTQVGNAAKWTQQGATSERRDSGYWSPQLDEEAVDTDGSEGRNNQPRAKNSSKKSACPFKYTTTVDIPFSLPTGIKKIFLPTFHSCLISRTYVLQLNVSIGSSSTTMSLAVPLQIGVETVNDPMLHDELPSFETALAQAQQQNADAYLHPEMFDMAGADFQGGGTLPGYDHVRGHPIPVSH